MNKYLFFSAAVLFLFGNISCNDPKTDKMQPQHNKTQNIKKKGTQKVIATIEKRKNIIDFLPKGYIIFDKVYGDLNKDGLEDCIVIIKGTDKKKIIKVEDGELDRNRRGIIILLNKNDTYELAVKNYDCFSNENDMNSELLVCVKRGNLCISFLYLHDAYSGSWEYTFRFQNTDFELIGYDSIDNHDESIVNNVTSINYVTKKKIEKQNTNENAEGGDEVFQQTVTRVNSSKLIKLSEIKDFDELE